MPPSKKNGQGQSPARHIQTAIHYFLAPEFFSNSSAM